MIAKKKITVNAEWIQQYAESIGAPLQYLHGKLVAPATMPIIFWQQFDRVHNNNQTPLLHGSQQFFYHAPMVEGMILACELVLAHTEHKQGKQGPMTFFTYILDCYEHDVKIVQLKTVLIQVGAKT